MAKKRDRRVPSFDRRNEPPPQLAHSSLSSNWKLAITFVIIFIVSSAVSVIVYRLRYAPITDRTDSYVFRQGLVKPDVNYQVILTEHEYVSENLTGRHYKYPVLGYITPWNSKGYDLAKKFSSKFTHLAPVWYALKSQGTSLVLEGRHNADRGWISDLRMAGDAWLLPRVVLEAFPAELLSKKKQRTKAIDIIVSECKEMGYDGIVLESWSRWAVYRVLDDPNVRNLALQFIKDLGDALHAVTSKGSNKNRLQLVYVIGPPHTETLHMHDFGPKDLQSLSDAVDRFSLMTYDYSGTHNPGPNAPLKWIDSVLQLLLDNDKNSALANKILLGINFYGNDYILAKDHAGHPAQGGGAITGRDYLSLLEKYKPEFRWEKNSAEHLFFYTDNGHNNHAVFYPTLLSISMRLEEARDWGCGISIWEIGQGLDYFFDLL